MTTTITPINRPPRSRPSAARMWWIATSTILMALLLSGCRRTVIVTPTPLPADTLTPTPLSTALPTVEPQPTAGGAARPYQLVLMPPTSGSDGDPEALQGYLSDQTGFTFDIVRAATPSEALRALCSATPALALVDGWTLLAAQADGCTRTLLSVTRGAGAAARTGWSADLIVPATSEATNAAGLRGSVFCRLNADDLETWILPTLIMRTAPGFDPFRDFQSVRDVPDLQAIVNEVANGQCVGAIPAGTLSRYGGADQVRVLDSSPELPFGGVVVSASLSPAAQANLQALSGAGSVSEDFLAQLAGLINGDSVQTAQASRIEAMLGFMQRARFDLTAMR